MVEQDKYVEVSSKPSWVVLALLGLGFVNQGLLMFGYSPLPFENHELEAFLTLGYNIVLGVIAWFKDMPTSKEGRIGTAVTRQLKKEKQKDIS